MPKVHFGSRGGAYVMKAGKKVYIKNKFGVDGVFGSPEEAYYAMLDKALYYQRELDKCQGSLLSRGSSPASWDGPISISRQSSLNSGESTPRILRGVDPRYLKRP